MSDRPSPRVAVVGAGIAGLAAAYRLRTRRPELEVTVFDGAPVVGGKLRVSEVAGLPVDEGAEAMLYRRPEAVALAREVGLGGAVEHPRTLASAVWTRGALRRLPPTMMGVPTDVVALARSGIVTPGALLRMQLDRVLPRSLGPDEDTAIGELVARRLGPEVRDRLLEPLLGGVYAGHTGALSLRAGVPQVAALVDRDRSLLRAAHRQRREAAPRQRREAAPRTDPVFAGVHGGVGRLPEAVATASGARIRTRAMVRALDRRDGGWRLTLGPTRDEEQFDADAVVLAVPAAPASRLLRATVPIAADALAGVDYASVALVTAVFRREAVQDRLPGSGFLVPPVDDRTIKAATFSSNKWGWLADADPGLVAVRLSLGRHREEQVLQRDDEELAALAVADLRRATGIEGAPVATRVTRWGGALPQYAVGHADRVRSVRAALSAVPGIAVCGAAYSGVGIPACIASADEAVTQVLADLDARETMRS